MIYKTKAAKTGRHCYYSEGSSAVQGILTFVCSSCIRKHHRKLFAAGGQSLSAPVITGTAPLARLSSVIITGKFIQENQDGPNLDDGVQPHQRVYNFFPTSNIIMRANLLTSHMGCSALAHTPFPQIWGEQDQRTGSTAMQHTPEISRSFDRYPDIGYQLFGSIPLCFNSFRTIRLSQAERVASPSSCMAATIASSSAGSTRKAICLLPLGIFMFDMCLTLGVIFVVSSNVHHVSDTCKARSPAVLPALTGPLTTNRYTR